MNPEKSVSLERDSNSITVSNFYEQYTLNKYDMKPAYQRESVWSDEKKSFFIDSVLKNLPIPPVFLRQRIDTETGKSLYEVIDGKQRLTSILEFIKGEIATADESDDAFHDAELAGKYFDELQGDKLESYKRSFWRYALPIEYIDTDSDEVIERIFDRLNRNGEPLTGQELRHSNYHSSDLLKICYSMRDHKFWTVRLSGTDRARMEDVEFISELVFVLLENKELHANDSILDSFYEKYSKDGVLDYTSVEKDFLDVTAFMETMRLNFDGFKINGVSHLYGLWCFSHYCVKLGIKPNDVASKINNFYTLLKARDYSDPNVKIYKDSMSSGTKMQSQRKRRKQALIEFVGV